MVKYLPTHVGISSWLTGWPHSPSLTATQSLMKLKAQLFCVASN